MYDVCSFNSQPTRRRPSSTAPRHRSSHASIVRSRSNWSRSSTMPCNPSSGRLRPRSLRWYVISLSLLHRAVSPNLS